MRGSKMRWKPTGTWGLLIVAAAVVSLAPGQATADGGPKVVVTIKPLHSLVAAVMKGVAEPTLLVDGVQSPHAFALKPSQARALNGADFVFLADEALEAPVTRIAGSLPASVQVVPLIEAPGVSVHALRTGVAFERHDHGHGTGDHDDHSNHDDHSDHGESHDDHKHAGKEDSDHSAVESKDGHKDEHKAHDHADNGHGEKHEDAANRDPHFWLDPRNAKAVVQHVAGLMAQRFPAHAGAFEANASALEARLTKLEAEITQHVRALMAA